MKSIQEKKAVSLQRGVISFVSMVICFIVILVSFLLLDFKKPSMIINTVAYISFLISHFATIAFVIFAIMFIINGLLLSINVPNAAKIDDTEQHFLKLAGGGDFSGWKCVWPDKSEIAAVSRMLISPNGNRFWICVDRGYETREYGDWEISYDKNIHKKLRKAAYVESYYFRQAKEILWVIPNNNGNYSSKADEGVLIVFSSPEEFAQQLLQWDTMQSNLQSSDFSEQGKQAERDAAEELRQILPQGWSMETSILLMEGGDADIVLRTDGGKIFVMDVKSRRDQMDLSAPKGDRVKSWPEIYDQVSLATRQIDPKAFGVVWQPLTHDNSVKQVNELLNVRGDAKYLLLTLDPDHQIRPKRRIRVNSR